MMKKNKTKDTHTLSLSLENNANIIKESLGEEEEC